MRLQLPQTRSKSLLLGVIEMTLITKKDDLVFEQKPFDGGYCLVW